MFKVGFLSQQSVQTLSQGPNSPTNAFSDGQGDAVWVNPNNALIADNVFATCTYPFNDSYTDYLRVENFGFSIPLTATITGLQMSVKGKITSNTCSIDSMYLWDGVNQLSSISNPSITFNTTNTTYTYGTSTGLDPQWNLLSLAPSVVNSAAFGVSFTIYGSSVAGQSVQIDAVSFKVFYTP